MHLLLVGIILLAYFSTLEKRHCKTKLLTNHLYPVMKLFIKLLQFYHDGTSLVQGEPAQHTQADEQFGNKNDVHQWSDLNRTKNYDRWYTNWDSFLFVLLLIWIYIGFPAHVEVMMIALFPRELWAKCIGQLHSSSDNYCCTLHSRLLSLSLNSDLNYFSFLMPFILNHFLFTFCTA